MKNTFLIIFITLLVFSSCSKDEKGYSLYRKYFPNAFITRNGAELHTAGLADGNAINENGKPIQSAYWAMIQGEFTDIEDTIIQYGHCWSLENANPYIIKKDTGSYSKFEGRDFDEIKTFTSVISNLMPETPFFVRTYVITSQGDTGYNKTVFVDTTLSPVNEWFRKKDFLIGGSTAREGSVCFTLYNKEKGYDCAYVYGGNVGISYYKDLYEYDAKTDTWEQLNSVESPSIRSEAVAFSIEYYNSSGQKQISGFVGTGKDLANNKLDDWYEYYPDHNHWKPRENYPRGVSNAVGFGIGEKGYVGTGSSEGDILVSEFYSYNPIADTIGGSPWVQVTQFANNQSLKRKNGIAFVIDGFAFVGTGEGVGGVLYKDLWLFAPGDDMQNFGAWIQRESLPDSITGRTDAVGFSIEAQGYVGMGFDGVNSLQDLWRYDPFNDRWAQCADYKTGPNYIEGDPKYIRNAIGFGIEDRGFVGLGFRSSTYPGDKCSYELWVYRPW